MRELGSYSPSHLIELILLVIHKNLPSILPSAIFFSWNLHAEMSLSPTYAEHACACKCIISIYKSRGIYNNNYFMHTKYILFIPCKLHNYVWCC